MNLSASTEIKILISQIEMYEKQVLDIEMKINQIMKQIDSKITSIPGISEVLVAAILDEIGNIDRFNNVKQLTAYAGLDPIVRKSGRYENKTGHISKRGSPLLRHALFLAANTARQNDENLSKYFNKKMDEGKHYLAALNTTAAKVLRIVFWVLKNNKEYKLKPQAFTPSGEATPAAGLGVPALQMKKLIKYIKILMSYQKV